MSQHEHDAHDEHGGLHRDLIQTGITRRQLLRTAAQLGAGFGAFHLLGCSSAAAADVTGSVGGQCSRIPEETAGPFPGDGSNGANVLNLSGVVRSELRTSFAGLSGTADGIPLTVVLTLVSAATCEPLAGRAVYLWHCTRDGLYSLYSAGATNQNFLRGVQQADSSGKVTFTTAFPGCYAGRWPHIHFEVFPTLAAAANFNNKVATSQIALPKDACDAVYGSTGYSASVTNLSRMTLASDGVFSDGASLELATMSGNVTTGYTAQLSVAIAV
jgi:protocatechuate 3,4-dioxygenase beta subunit